MAQKLLDEMLENAVHFGHRTQKWDPRMRKFLYGEKDGVHLFNLEETAKKLDEALAFVSKLVGEGRTIMFVSTKPQALGIVEETAKECNMPFVVSRWIPGFLTNFSTISKRIKYLLDLESQEASGEFEKYTKKEGVKLKKTIAKLELSLGGVKNVSKIPDAIFVLDAVRDNIVIKEANRRGVPVVAIVDSNANPEEVTYPIPGNDDAIKSIKFFLAQLSAAIKGAKSAKK
jgi:small subunit ribosomal protein S2